VTSAAAVGGGISVLILDLRSRPIAGELERVLVP